MILFDLDPGQVADILGDRLPGRVARAYRRFRRGPAAYKVDFAVAGGVPWTAEAARRAGTVHVGETMAEIAAAERDVARGQLPERPFVLVGQQYLADPGRSVGDIHPVWAYAHVPHGYPGDVTGALIERFAPGFRERIIGMHVTRPTDFAAWNPNFAGGDILTGAKDIRQLMSGPGAHGMCGAHAAQRADSPEPPVTERNASRTFVPARCNRKLREPMP